MLETVKGVTTAALHNKHFSCHSLFFRISQNVLKQNFTKELVNSAYIYFKQFF